jgi:gluconate 2-dehydrogenase gamma chain
MHRRELLQLLSSAALSPVLANLSAERKLEIAEEIHARLRFGRLRVLTPEQEALVSEVCEMIIPRTETPGARDAKVSEFIDHLLADWYKEEDRDRFLRGLRAMDEEAQALGGTPFISATPNTQHALLTRWDNANSGPETATAQFKRLKSLAIYGYFTSEVAVREVTKPVLFHPQFEGCVPFPSGEIR